MSSPPPISKPPQPEPERESVESVASRVRSEVEAIPRRLGLRLAYHGEPIVSLGGALLG